MAREKRILTAFTLLACVVSAGCKKSSEDPARIAAPPAPIAFHPPCVLSMDCPSGQSCDLGECVQECNSETACAGGGRCSARARCVAPGAAEEAAPKPSLDHRGDVSAALGTTLLTADQRSLDVTLASTSTENVRYRIELTAPFLHIDDLRGEFVGSKHLTFAVDPTSSPLGDTPGSIHVVTSLGDVSLGVPLRRGLTGYYQGGFQYDGGSLRLGEASVGLELVEKDGAVAVRLDPDASLLFPRSAGGDAASGVAVTGSGRYASGDQTLDVTIVQPIDQRIGGPRNFLHRDVTRTVRLSLKVGTGGALEGDFAEQDEGIFATAATTKGHVVLRAVPGRTVGDVQVAVTRPPATAPVAAYASAYDVFGWMDGATCADVAVTACVLLDPSKRADCRALPGSYAEDLVAALTAPLAASLTSVGFGDMATDCAASFTAPSAQAYLADPRAQKCGMIAPLACLLDVTSSRGANADADGRTFSAIVARLIAPAQLIAKEDLVQGLKASFTGGNLAESVRYGQAVDALRPAATWVLQPRVLEYLRAMSGDAARGDGGDATLDSYPAARALAELAATLTLIDGERARLAADGSPGQELDLARDAQERALLAHIEALALGALVDSWKTVPLAVTSRFSGFLDPLNRGYAALTQKAGVFGVPTSFVPFLYRPDDPAKGTNFEQVFAESERRVKVATDAFDLFARDDQQYEVNDEKLRGDELSLQSQYDARLKEICGLSFDPDSVRSDADWSRCGASNEGRIASLGATSAIVGQHLSAGRSRIRAKEKDIEISVNTLSRVYGLRQDDIAFISETGEQINALSFAQNIIAAVEKTLTIAGEGSLLNAFAPTALAPVVAILGVINAGLDLAKDELRLMQSLKTASAEADVEYLKAMEGVQREMIELGQMRVELLEDQLRVAQASLDARNAVDEARETLSLRQRAADAIARSSATDPSYRLLRDELAVRAIQARADAQLHLLLSGRALEYEMNMSLADVDGAVLAASSGNRLTSLASCMLNVFGNYRFAFGTPQEYVSTISVRKTLGIDGPRTDAVTGETWSEGALFRERLLQNQNLDGRGGVGLQFSTTLQPNNGLWSDSVCGDRISAIQAQLVGDFLGDNQAQLDVTLDGTSIMRACDSDRLTSWSLGSTEDGSQATVAVVQAGVNSFGDSPPNGSLFGQSVARATWKILVPGAAGAPMNADVDLTKLDDIVLRVSHRALPRRAASIPVDTSCLGQLQ